MVRGGWFRVMASAGNTDVGIVLGGLVGIMAEIWVSAGMVGEW